MIAVEKSSQSWQAQDSLLRSAAAAAVVAFLCAITVTTARNSNASCIDSTGYCLETNFSRHSRQYFLVFSVYSIRQESSWIEQYFKSLNICHVYRLSSFIFMNVTEVLYRLIDCRKRQRSISLQNRGVI